MLVEWFTEKSSAAVATVGEGRSRYRAGAPLGVRVARLVLVIVRELPPLPGLIESRLRNECNDIEAGISGN